MKKKSHFIIVNAIIWAALMLSTALLFTTVDADLSRTYGYLLTVILVPLWFASDQLVRKALKVPRD